MTKTLEANLTKVFLCVIAINVLSSIQEERLSKTIFSVAVSMELVGSSSISNEGLCKIDLAKLIDCL